MCLKSKNECIYAYGFCSLFFYYFYDVKEDEIFLKLLLYIII